MSSNALLSCSPRSISHRRTRTGSAPGDAGHRDALSDRGALASALKACGFAAAELKQAVEAIYGKVESSQQVETTGDTSDIIERIDLKRDGMQITLNPRALLQADRFPAGGTNLRMTRLLALQMRRRGPYTALRDAIFAHPTMSEGLVCLLGQVESTKG